MLDLDSTKKMLNNSNYIIGCRNNIVFEISNLKSEEKYNNFETAVPRSPPTSGFIEENSFSSCQLFASRCWRQCVDQLVQNKNKQALHGSLRMFALFVCWITRSTTAPSLTSATWATSRGFWRKIFGHVSRWSNKRKFDENYHNSDEIDRRTWWFWKWWQCWWENTRGG